MAERTYFWRPDIVKKRVSERACNFFEIPAVYDLQYEVCESVLDGKDILLGVPTGGGKTLSFYLPLPAHWKPGGNEERKIALPYPRKVSLSTERPLFCSQSSPSTLTRFSRSTLSLHQAGAPAVNLPPAAANLRPFDIRTLLHTLIRAFHICTPIAYPYPNLICLSIRWTNFVNANGTAAAFREGHYRDSAKRLGTSN
ncbi:hypothetical protein M422DRAFT_245887 [Sphaerobolus stellatus SS14]|nr:hypothetical protein M422DRAFT_245887 [Sphaerobolus stellatus SS14]